MKTHYVTIKEYLAYMSGVCQDPILDFPVDVLPEEGVESQPVDEEQEEKWGRSKEKMWQYKNVDMGERAHNETSEWPAIPQVFALLGTGDESNNRAVPDK
jgi:hypothetical protein